jgi:NAD(P)-dependent dehydrogenase (short-subunit alcohol dehydrogenase family)
VRGIGLAICKRLIQRGVLVTAGYSRNEQATHEFKTNGFTDADSTWTIPGGTTAKSPGRASTCSSPSWS